MLHSIPSVTKGKSDRYEKTGRLEEDNLNLIVFRYNYAIFSLYWEKYLKYHAKNRCRKV